MCQVGAPLFKPIASPHVELVIRLYISDVIQNPNVIVMTHLD